jgi:hypothetical protein
MQRYQYKYIPYKRDRDEKYDGNKGSQMRSVWSMQGD